MKVSLIKDLIIHPKEAFIEITENENKYFGIALVIVGISLIVGLFEFGNLMSVLVPDTENKTTGFYFYSIVSAVLGPFLTAWLILKLSKKLNKTQSNFRRVFSAIQFSYIPSLLIGTPIQAIAIILLSDYLTMGGVFNSIPLIVPFTIPFSIWTLILWIMACKQSLQLDTTNVIAVSILMMIIMTIIFVPISILLIGSPISAGWFDIK
ncbi:MAG: YIP1 family protein [Candidatus Nitrosopumilus sp. bin_32a]